MKLALILTPVLVACSLDSTVGSLELTDEPDAATPDGGVPYDLVFADGAESILVQSEDLLLTANSVGLVRITSGVSAETLVPGVGGRMVQDEDRLYIADHSNSIIAIDKLTLAQTTLSSGWNGVGDIAVDADWVYFTDNVVPAAGRLLRIAKTGGTPQVLLGGLDAPFGVAVDDDFVYLAEDLGGRIHAVPKNGCDPIVLASGVNRPAGLLLGGDWLYFTERGNLYTDGTIRRVARPTSPCSPAEPGDAPTLVTGLGHPTWMAVADDQLYWTGYFSGLQRAPLDGGTAETLLGCFGGTPEPMYAPPQGCAAIAIRDGEVIYSARHPNYAGAVYAVPVEGP